MTFDSERFNSFDWRQEIRAQLSRTFFEEAYAEETKATQAAHAYLADIVRMQHPIAALDLVGRFKGVYSGGGTRIDSVMSPGYKVRVTPSPSSSPPPQRLRSNVGRIAGGGDSGSSGGGGEERGVEEEWYGATFVVAINLNQLRALKSSIKVAYGEERYGIQKRLLFETR